jgi:hypothetical protein
MEQSVNQIISLKQFLLALRLTHEALANAQTTLMAGIREVSIRCACSATILSLSPELLTREHGSHL